MKKIVTIFFLLSSALLKAQLPDTDIFLSEMKMESGKFVFSDPVNITNREGYDNQPRFFPDGGIYFVSFRDTLQSDIFRYDIKTKTIAQITNTKESEFSPTPVPADANKMSVVRVDLDSSQFLYEINLKGENPSVIIKSNDTIGYHAWLDKEHIACFVLGNPETLKFYDLKSSTSKHISNKPGRCMMKIPNEDAISYVDKQDSTKWFIKKLSNGISVNITQTLQGNEDYCWTPGGKILMGKDGLLYICDPKTNSGWAQVADFSKSIGNFYRIAIDEKGTRIALVAFKGKKP